MSARGAMHLRRSLFVAATVVAIHALVLLACYTVPSLQTHQRSQSLLQPLSNPSQKQDLVNVSMLTVTMTGCSKAADWQAMGLYHSFLRSGQPGRFVRIAACLPGEGSPTALVPTWTTEGIVDVGSITYPLFNKPWALYMYMKRAHVTEDYILVLDSDMLIHRPLLLSNFKVSETQAASENMWYLDDLNTVLVPELLPELPIKADNDANPGPGRRADEVGEFYFMHRKQWEIVAPKWYEHTLPIMQTMLHRPQLWQKRNMTRTTPWYGEMYAYGLATAEAGVKHLASSSTVFHMRYYHPHGNPHLLHYAWSGKADGLPWEWDKHNYQGFEVEVCPPWSGNKGLFPHPPMPSELTTKGGDFIRDLLNVEVVATLNLAFCKLHHLKHCSDETYVNSECAKVDRLNEEIKQTWRKLEQQPGGLHCIDMLPEGTCRPDRCELKRLKYSAVKNYCRKTCDHCHES